MSFWSTFYKQSLGSPWVIQGESTASNPLVSSVAPIVFWAPEDAQGGPLHQMMERMVAAVGLAPEQVSMEFSSWQESSIPEGVEKVLVFGAENGVGQFQSTGSAQVMHTHALGKIASDKSIKAQTWAHLKRFSGLS